MRKLIIALALIAASTLGMSSPASADIPPAEFVCLAERPNGAPSDWQVIYAEYDQVTTTYVRAACWIVRIGAGPAVSCTGYMYLTAAGQTTGGDNGWDC